MTAEGTFTHDSEIDRIFGPVVQARSYKNLLYLALSFPLGIFYFVTLITGLSMSVGLAVILVGFLTLAITLGLARIFGTLERSLTAWLLGATFEPPPPLVVAQGQVRAFRAMLTNRQSWLAVLYLILRFPIGVVGFVASTLVGVSAMMMATPLLYNVLPYTIGDERIGSSEEALLVSVFGCVLFLLSIHAVNGLAAVSRRLAEALL